MGLATLTKVTIYGGASEIGGNKVLVEDLGTKVFFDFGKSVSAERSYFGEGIFPHPVNGVGDYLEFDLLPRLPGLYDKRQIKSTWMAYRPPEYHGVIVSHSHVDHAGHIGFLDRSIPIYCGETSMIILSALVESSAPRGPRMNIPSFKPFRTGSKIKVDDIEVEPVHVDHSVPGAYGFIIHTSSGIIVYTGDLRLHGPVPELTQDFITRATEARPDVLLCEGTNVGGENESKLNSETEVKEKARALVSKTSGFVAASFNIREIDRFNTFHAVAEATNRKLVLPLRTAHLLMHLAEDIHLKVPDIARDESLLIYKKEGMIDRRSGKEIRYNWEKEVLRNYPADKIVGYRYVHDNQSSLILALEQHDFAELVDIRPELGGTYIHSKSEVFSEEEELGERIVGNWLSHFDMKLHHLHTSGHAHAEDIRTIIERVCSKQLIPIHTEHPDIFARLAGKLKSKVVLLKKAETLELK